MSAEFWQSELHAADLDSINWYKVCRSDNLGKLSMRVKPYGTGGSFGGNPWSWGTQPSLLQSVRERERAGESHDRVVIVKAPVTLLELELSAWTCSFRKQFSQTGKYSSWHVRFCNSRIFDTMFDYYVKHQTVQFVHWCSNVQRYFWSGAIPPLIPLSTVTLHHWHNWDLEQPINL